MTTEATSVQKIAEDGLCDIIACDPFGTGSYPVSNPPPWDPSLVSLTPVDWRRVYRRTVDDLTFPMTFSAANDVGSSCGPMCAENISESIPTLSTTLPDFVCDAYPAVIACDGCYANESFEQTNCGSAPVVDCRYTCDPTSSYLWRAEKSGARNTEELRSDSGVITSGSLPSFAIPDSFSVTLS
jgi:hypothetical protein